MFIDPPTSLFDHPMKIHPSRLISGNCDHTVAYEPENITRGVGFESSSIKWGFLLISINICRFDLV